MKSAFKTVRIDPRDFIASPYERCPKCHKQEFGVLNVHDSAYTRRCRTCLYMLDFVLPTLKKKVVYLDQFVFSNIVKMLSADAPGHKRAKSEPLWRDLFESLDVLCRMQLVICPDSKEHHAESLISPFYKQLKHTYEHFSTGISFERSIRIQHKQVHTAFNCYLNGRPAEFDLDPQSVTSYRLHGWHDRIFVTVSGNMPGERQKIQQSRRSVHTSLGDVFKYWQQGGQTFAQVFEREKAAYGKTTWDGFVSDMRKFMQVASGQLPATFESFVGSLHRSLIQDLDCIARMHGLAPDKAIQAVKGFIASGAVNDTPSNNISAAMFASLAVKAAAGQKKPPDEGMATDIDIVSTFLPYCDAMFVDNKCRSLLHDIPKTHKPPYACLVFSPKTSAEFLQYLSDIRNGATAEHLDWLQEVYGPAVLQPPTSIYGVG